ncbi:MAG: YggT family protein [Proteobacteria bacterium]|nr:YggT family protein [Pseudomonadota bacterium]
MDIIFVPILNCIGAALYLYRWVIFVYIILGWLEFFKVVNPYSQIVYSIHNTLFSLVEPALAQIRRLLPSRTAIDFSPVILILIVYFCEDVLHRLLFKFT